MRPDRQAIALLLLVTVAAGCGSERGKTFDSAGGALAGGSPVDSLIEARVPRAVAGEPHWGYEQVTHVDLDRDGIEERVVVIANVELDESGQPLWEDGHGWQVYVEEPDSSRTYLYARFLPNGKLMAEVTDTSAAAGRRPSVLLLEQTPFTLALYEIQYDGKRATVRSRTVRTLDRTKSFVRRLR